MEIVGFNLQKVGDVVNHVIRQFENGFSSFRILVYFTIRYSSQMPLTLIFDN